MSTVLTQRQQTVEAAKQALIAIQTFDPESIGRQEDLGKLNFEHVVPHARQVVELYRLLPISALDRFNHSWASSIRDFATHDLSILRQAVDANPERQDWVNLRLSLSQQIESMYETSFQNLSTYLAWSKAVTIDSMSLQSSLQAAVATAQRDATEMTREIAKIKSEAESVLAHVRSVAAEQGVSQQAVYFKTEADSHDASAKTWLIATVSLAVLLGGYAVSTLFLHKITLLAPTNVLETAQLGISKVLMFSTIVFALVLAGKNFVAHRHNSIVNRHRYNALRTYTAIVDAAGDEANRDIVLSKAAECIFTPQPTSFGKADGNEMGAVSMISLSPNGVKHSFSPASGQP